MYSKSQIGEIEKNIGYVFHDKELLIEALSHPSLNKINVGTKPKDYERLELLGDTVLNLVITEELIDKFERLQEGKLAQVRAYLVSRNVISKIAEKISISEYIIMSRGEEISGGRRNVSNIENVVEAIIGAIYKDSEIDVAKSWIINLWQEYIDNSLQESMEFDPKSRLQELTQSLKLGIPKYTVLKISGTDHAPIFTIEAKVSHYITVSDGNTKKSAEKIAAHQLLQIIKNEYQLNLK